MDPEVKRKALRCAKRETDGQAGDKRIAQIRA